MRDDSYDDLPDTPPEVEIGAGAARVLLCVIAVLAAWLVVALLVRLEL